MDNALHTQNYRFPVPFWFWWAIARYWSKPGFYKIMPTCTPVISHFCIIKCSNRPPSYTPLSRQYYKAYDNDALYFCAISGFAGPALSHWFMRRRSRLTGYRHSPHYLMWALRFHLIASLELLLKFTSARASLPRHVPTTTTPFYQPEEPKHSAADYCEIRCVLYCKIP